MKARIWTSVAAMALLCVCAVPASAQLAPALSYALKLNLDTYNRRDLNATMRTIDSKSPDYASTKAAVAAQFQDSLDATAELVDFTLIGHDDEFAVGRAKVKTTGKPGTGFTNNTVDAMVIFHQENGDWKLWDELILGAQTSP